MAGEAGMNLNLGFMLAAVVAMIAVIILGIVLFVQPA